MSKANSIETEPLILNNVPYKDQFKEGLKRLTAKRTVIEHMTRLAEIAIDDAPVICKMIEHKLVNSPKEAVLSTFYLIDSIIKGIPAYNALFAPRIYALFVHAYSTCSTSTLRERLQGVYETWVGEILSFPREILDKIKRYLERASQMTDNERRKALLTPDALTYTARDWLRYTIHLDWKLNALQNDLGYLSERELTLYKYFQRERNECVMKVNDILDSMQDDLRPKSTGDNNISPVLMQVPDEFKIHAPRYGQELHEIKIALDRLNQRQDEFVKDIKNQINTAREEEARKNTIRQRRLRFEYFMQENEVVLSLAPRKEFFPTSLKVDFAEVIKKFGKHAVDKDSVGRLDNGRNEEQRVAPARNRNIVESRGGEKAIKIKKEVTKESEKPSLGDDLLGLFGSSGSSLLASTESKRRRLNDDSSLEGQGEENGAAERHNNYSQSGQATRNGHSTRNRFHQSEGSMDIEDDSDVEIASVISFEDADEKESSQPDDSQKESEPANATPANVTVKKEEVKPHEDVTSAKQEKSSSPEVVIKKEKENTFSNKLGSSSLLFQDIGLGTRDSEIEANSKISSENGKLHQDEDKMLKPTLKGLFVKKEALNETSNNTGKGSSKRPVSAEEDSASQDIMDDLENPESVFNEPSRPPQHDIEDDLENPESVFNEPAKPPQRDIEDDLDNFESVFNEPAKPSQRDIEDALENPESVFNEPAKSLQMDRGNAEDPSGISQESKQILKEKKNDLNNQESKPQEAISQVLSPEKPTMDSRVDAKPLENLAKAKEQEIVEERESVTENILPEGSSSELEPTDHPFPLEKRLLKHENDSRPFTNISLFNNAYQSASATTVPYQQESMETESQENAHDSDVDMTEADTRIHPTHEQESHQDSYFESNTPLAKLRPPTPPIPSHAPAPTFPTSDINSDPSPESLSSNFDVSQIGFRPPTPPNASHTQSKSASSPVEPIKHLQDSNTLKRSRPSPEEEESSPKRMKMSSPQPSVSAEPELHSPSLQGTEVSVAATTTPTPSSLPPPPVAKAPIASHEQDSIGSKEVDAKPQDSKVEAPASQKPEPTRKLSLSEFKLKRQKSDSQAAPVAIMAASAYEHPNNSNNSSTTTAAAAAAASADVSQQQSQSGQVAEKSSPPSGLKSILRVPIEGENKAKKRVRWDPSLL